MLPEKRAIDAAQLRLLAPWLDSDPDVPAGKWPKQFPEMAVCGEGGWIKTFLRVAQVAEGGEVH